MRIIRKNKKTAFITFCVSIIVICLMYFEFNIKTVPYSLAVNQNARILIDTQLDKYYNYDLFEKGNGTLIQYTIREGVEYQDDSEFYPIKENSLNVQFNKIDGMFPESCNVIAINTEATNGNLSKDKVSCNYDNVIGRLTITTSNLDENGNSIKTEMDSNGRDEYVIICNYDSYTDKNDLRNLSLNIFDEISMNTDFTTKLVSSSSFEDNVTKNVGELNSVIYNTDDIYNGFIKSNIINDTEYETDYNDNLEIFISKKDAQSGELKISEDTSFVRINEEKESPVENDDNLVYLKSIVSKSDIENVLGVDGEISILDKDEKELTKINKDTEFDEDGTYTYVYPENTKGIIIKTSEPKSEGLIKINNIKAIKNTFKDIDNVKIKTATKFNDKVNDRILDIKDAENDVSFKLNNSDWTNKNQNEIEFVFDLNAKDSSKNLYNEPEINIELPNEVEKVILDDGSINSGNGLDIESESVDKNAQGNYVITVKLSGKQNDYVQNDLGLSTEVKIPATIILNKDLDNQEEKVNVQFVNNYSLDNKSENKNLNADISIEDYKSEESTENTNVSEKTESVKTVENNDSDETESKQSLFDENEDVSSSYKVNNIVKNTSIKGLDIKVEPVVGDMALDDNSTIYEGEYIKYNISISNNSGKDLENVKVLATIPDGVTYGDVNYNFDTEWGQYQYNFDESIKEKEIDIGTIKNGETSNKYYEVHINDLADGETEKQIVTSIKSFVGDSKIQENIFTNKVEKAEYKVFMGTSLGSEDDGWFYNISVTSNEDKKIPVTIKVPKEFRRIYLLEEETGEQINYDENSDLDSEFTVDLNTNKSYILNGYVHQKDIHLEKGQTEVELTASASVTDNDKTYLSNEARLITSFKDFNVTITSPNEGEEVKPGDKIDYKITVSNIGKANAYQSDNNFINVNIMDYLPDDINPKSMTYNTWNIEEKPKEENGENAENGVDNVKNDSDIETEYTGKYEKGEDKTEDISMVTKDSDGNKKANIDLNLYIPYGESTIIDVETEAGFVYEKTKVENTVTVVSDNIGSKTSNTITHTIVPNELVKLATEQENNNNQDNNNQNNNNENNKNENNNNVSNNNSNNSSNNNENNSNVNNNKELQSTDSSSSNTYTISGLIWKDENGDGQKQSKETVIGNVDTILINSETGKTAVDKDGKELTTKTNNNGTYEFSNILAGKYVVLFKYDTNKYHISSNNGNISQRNITFNGEQLTAGLSNTIDLNTNINNLNLGLSDNKISDLRLDKYVSKVTVQTKNGTKTYDYNDSQLAKTEIRAKEVEGANVVVEYKIVITNEGELVETVNKVVDYVPDGFDVSSTLNTDWAKTSNGSYVNTSLSGKKISPGEKAELKLILTKTMTASSTGTYTNIAEIADASNSSKIADRDSTPNNKNEKEDDYSKAQLILSVSTGTEVFIAIAIIAGVALVVTIIILKTNKKLSKIGKGGLFALFIVVFLICGGFSNVTDGSGDYDAFPYYTTFSASQIRGHNGYTGVTTFVGGPGGVGGICLSPGHQIHGVTNPSKGAACQGGNNTYYRGSTRWQSKVSSSIASGSHAKASISSGVTNINIKDQNGRYLYGPFKISTSNNATDGKSKLTIYVKDMNGNNLGNSTCDSSGNYKALSTSANDQEFYISVSANDVANGISRIVAKISSTTDYVEHVTEYGKYIYYPGDDCQHVGTHWRPTIDKYVPHTETVEAQIEWTSEVLPPVLVLEKRDVDNNQPLAGVKLKISGNGFEKEVTTGSDGKTPLIAGVEIGKTYQIYEIYNPIYGFVYDPNTPIDSVTVQGGDSPKIIKIDNKQTIEDLVIEKVSKRHPEKKLKGVKFKITSDEDPEYNVEVETGDDGKTPVIKDLKIGKKYKIFEIYNPIYGYVYDENTPFDVIIIEKGPYNQAVVKVEENEKTYEEIQIEKVDEDNNTKKLANVKFRIKSNEDTSFDKTVVTGADGKTPVIQDLMIGKAYQVYEIENPNYGYVCDPNTPIMTITPEEDNPEDGVIAQYVATNKQVYVKLSGFVWEDMLAEKQSVRDYVLNSASEKGFNGISVTLRDTRTNGGIAQSYFDAPLETTTSELGIYSEIDGGEYQLKDIKISDLQYYYVEFDYDGLKYQSVPLVDRRIDKTEKSGYPFVQLNTSRATDRTDREALDAAFSSIDGNGTNILHVGQYNLEYNPTQNNVAEFKGSNCIVKATTLDTQTSYQTDSEYSADKQLNINDLYEPGYTGEADKPGEEIRYVNLGLYEKPQADMALGQDLQSVNVAINGYNHVYQYGTIKSGSFERDDSDSWNVGVKFKREYKAGYKRAIYKADSEYQSDDKSKELQVYLTYKIALRNQSSYTTRINSVIEYYDSRYQLQSAGLTLHDNLSDTSTEFYDVSSQQNGSVTFAEGNSKFGKVIINNTNIIVEPNTTQYLYIKFKLDRANVSDLLKKAEQLSLSNQENANEDVLMYVTAEINSYTVFKDGKTVAAIDVDSVPGNAVIGDVNTYEDDTDSAPPIQLEVADAREITGSVFEDNSELNLANNERHGDGKYDVATEKGINGVKVTLQSTEDKGATWKTAQVYTATSDANATSGFKDAVVDTSKIDNADGTYKISGFIPGQYRLVYTWGDEVYRVQYFMGTTYQAIRKDNYDNNNNHLTWYKDDVDIRYQDATDDYNRRLEIDKEIANVDNCTINSKIYNAYASGDTTNSITLKTMDSMTPRMEFGVEYDSAVTEEPVDKLVFKVNNIDFGIVERPRQELEIKKQISNFKITLANGQVLIDATVDENGNLGGTHNYLTTMQSVYKEYDYEPEFVSAMSRFGWRYKNNDESPGFIKAEMDSELIQGSTLEINYRITVTNKSEADYMSQDFYKYAIIDDAKKDDLAVTITPTSVVDYLDNKYAFNPQYEFTDTYKKNGDDNGWTKWEANADTSIKDSKVEYAKNFNSYVSDNTRMVLYTQKFDKALKPAKQATTNSNNEIVHNGDSQSLNLGVSKLLTTSDDLSFNNTAEVSTIGKSTNSNFGHTGGPLRIWNHDSSTTAEVTPSTGGNKNYVLPVTVGIVALIVLGVGIFFIRKSIANTKKR